MASLTSTARTTCSTRQLASMNGKLCDGLMSSQKKLGAFTRRALWLGIRAQDKTCATINGRLSLVMND